MPEQNERIAGSVDTLTSGAVPADAAVNTTEKPRSLGGDAWRDLRRNPVFIISALLIALLAVVSLWPGLFTSVSPHDCDMANSRQPAESGHPFGYDLQGCDVYSRTIHGARASVQVGVLVTIGVALLGGILGGLAGFFGGWWDAILSRISEIFFGIPVILGALVFLSVLKDRTVWIIIGFLVAIAWPQISRIARGAVIVTKEQDYVHAAKALGASTGRIMVKHILPNAIAPVIVVATIALGTFISLEATLSYFGVGLEGTTVSWGMDISTASQLYRNSPHMLLYPAGALSVTVLAFIMLGDAVRDALDPKLR